MADKISVEIGLEGGEQVSQQLEQIGKSGEKAFGDIQDAADKVNLNSTASQFDDLGNTGQAAFQKIQTAASGAVAFEQVIQGVKKVEGSFEALGTAVSKMATRMTRSLGLLGVLARSLGPVGIAVGVLAGAFVKFGDDSADALNKLTTEAAKLGLSAQQLDILQKAFGKVGVSSDAVSSNLEQLRSVLGGGLFKVGDLVPPDATAGLQQFIAKLEQMPDGVQRTQLAMQTLGETLGGQVIAGLQAGTITAKNFADALGGVTPATQQQIVEAAKYQQALNQLGAAWTELKAAFAPIITPIFGLLTTELTNLKKDIQEIIQEFRFLKAIFDVFVAGVKGEDIGAAAKKAAEEYNKATQAAKETQQGFGTVTSTLQQSTEATKNNTGATTDNTGATKDGTQATEEASRAKQRMAEAARRAAQAAAEEAAAQERYAQTFTDGINHALAAYASLRDAQTAVVAGGQFSGAILSVNDLARAYALAAAEAQRLANYSRYIAQLNRPTSVPSLESQRPTSLAEGGLLGGRGTGTSDSNLAWLSRGEYVTPARAVAQPGVLAFLEALRRSGGNLSRVLNGMSHFALGGMVPRMPAFAAGGLAGGSNVTIQFPGLPAIGGLRASADVVGQLHRAAALAQVRSGGRKPSRYS